jgi:hypothetical protein
MDTSYVDYSSGADPNHILIKYNSQYFPVNNEYKDLIANYIFNQRFTSAKNTSNYKMRELTPVKIADGVNVGNDDVTINECYVSSRVIQISLSSLEVSYTVKSINPK